MPVLLLQRNLLKSGLAVLYVDGDGLLEAVLLKPYIICAGWEVELRGSDLGCGLAIQGDGGAGRIGADHQGASQRAKRDPGNILRAVDDVNLASFLLIPRLIDGHRVMTG